MDRLDLPSRGDPADLPTAVTEEEWRQWCRDSLANAADYVRDWIQGVPTAAEVEAKLQEFGEVDPFKG